MNKYVLWGLIFTLTSFQFVEASAYYPSSILQESILSESRGQLKQEPVSIVPRYEQITPQEQAERDEDNRKLFFALEKRIAKLDKELEELKKKELDSTPEYYQAALKREGYKLFILQNSKVPNSSLIKKSEEYIETLESLLEARSFNSSCPVSPSNGLSPSVSPTSRSDGSEQLSPRALPPFEKVRSISPILIENPSGRIYQGSKVSPRRSAAQKRVVTFKM